MFFIGGSGIRKFRQHTSVLGSSNKKAFNKQRKNIFKAGRKYNLPGAGGRLSMLYFSTPPTESPLSSLV
jgi:hypothetical protein